MDISDKDEVMADNKENKNQSESEIEDEEEVKINNLKDETSDDILDFDELYPKKISKIYPKKKEHIMNIMEKEMIYKNFMKIFLIPNIPNIIYLNKQ